VVAELFCSSALLLFCSFSSDLDLDRSWTSHDVESCLYLLTPASESLVAGWLYKGCQRLVLSSSCLFSFTDSFRPFGLETLPLTDLLSSSRTTSKAISSAFYNEAVFRPRSPPCLGNIGNSLTDTAQGAFSLFIAISTSNASVALPHSSTG
jgi:hypothetical protein